MPAAVVVEKSVELRSNPQKLWSFLADTDRLNRWMGLGPIALAPNEDDQSSARFIVSTTQFGIPIQYQEFPFEWSREHSYKVRRVFVSGPIEGYTFEMELFPKGEGTTLRARIEMTPKFELFRPVAWMIARSSVDKSLDAANEVDGSLVEHTPSPFLKPNAGCNESELLPALHRLQKAGVSDVLVACVRAFIADGSDADCVRIRPYELADRWQMDRREVARAFLHGIPAGLFELRWSLICPSCQTSTDDKLQLSDIGREGHCTLCDLSFELELDRAVEATFVPHPAVRKRVEQHFCFGGPARTPHVVLQNILSSQGTCTMAMPTAPGAYRLFARGGASASISLTPSSSAQSSGTSSPIALSDEGFQPKELSLAAGSMLILRNGRGEKHVKLEEITFSKTALSAHEISTLAEFRGYFSAELLKPETPLRVSSVALLFSDLVGSTALYSKVGDAAAFRLVDDHFDVLRGPIEAEGGTIVKTMGDAVMAAFTDSHACARAAIESLKAFESFRAKREFGALIGLKLGMHTGTCYVVSANGALDYFGQTVNIAARVQSLANASEVVLSASVYEEIGGARLERMRAGEHFSTKVKGVDEEMSLVRLQLVGSVRPPELR